jgi:hypothetical protein
MAGMQQIEDAVREDDDFAVPADVVDVPDGGLERHDG